MRKERSTKKDSLGGGCRSLKKVFEVKTLPEGNWRQKALRKVHPKIIHYKEGLWYKFE